MFLTRFASKVYLIHRRDTLRASKIMAERALGNPKIEPVWDSVIAEYLTDAEGECAPCALKCENRRDKASWNSSASSRPSATRPTRNRSRGKLDMDAEGYLIQHKERRRTFPASLRRATWRITSTGRRSPPPAKAAPPRSMPSDTSRIRIDQPAASASLRVQSSARTGGSAGKGASLSR